MNVGTTSKNSWPRRTAVVVSDSPNLQMLLRELLRSYHWTVIETTPVIERAVSLVTQGQVFLVICDDTPANPAVFHVRHLLSDPLTVCTPVLTFLSEPHKFETAALARMGRPMTVEKPLTPSKFIPGFVELLKAWEREPLLSLRKANYTFLKGANAQGLGMLAKLIEIDGARPFAAAALALHLRRAGRIKEAEKVLLAATKKAPKELGMIIALADLYLHAAMPKLAHRLLTSCHANYSESMAIIPDLAQACLLNGDVNEAVSHLHIMLRSDLMTEEVSSFLARLLFADGREGEAERALNNSKVAFGRMQSEWARAEAPPASDLGRAG